jgi:hypothetical protein
MYKVLNVIFSIPSGADIDKFGLDGEDNNVLHFDSTDFEARENNIYSVEVTARRDEFSGTETSAVVIRSPSTVTLMILSAVSMNSSCKRVLNVVRVARTQ